MNRCRMALLLMAALLALGGVHDAGAQTKPAGELVWAMHVTIAPAWFDPAEQGGLITPLPSCMPCMMASSGRGQGRRLVTAWQSPGRRAPMAWCMNLSCVRDCTSTIVTRARRKT